MRRFLTGLLLGLIVFALAFATVRAARSWREGRFDRYLPETAEEPAPPPPSLRWEREAPAHAADAPEPRHELQNPLIPPPHAAPADADDDDGSDGDGT